MAERQEGFAAPGNFFDVYGNGHFFAGDHILQFFGIAAGTERQRLGLGQGVGDVFGVFQKEI